jgi:RNA polymerase sigma factor (sigma-70 family)
MRSVTQNNFTNNELIPLVLGGNKIAIARFYYQVIGIIKSIIRKTSYRLKIYEIDSLAHDIFVYKIYYKLGKFNPQKSLVPYIHAIVRNSIIDLYRKQMKEKCQSLDILLENNSFEYVNSHSENPSPETLLIRDEEKEKLYKMLGQLSEFDRVILTGFYFEEKSLKQLALENKISVNSISIRLYRVKKKLNTFWGKSRYS